jgi:PTH1 family peptidyl-tRNA hydrolase
MFIIVALGNPGEEYLGTRHNTGRIILEDFWKKFDFPEFEMNKKYQSLSSEGKVGKEKVLLLEPETFMNKSGNALKTLVTSAKKAEQLIVVHDDLDIPLGKFKVSFNKSSGGHNGIESIIKAVKTQGFIRIRIGITPASPSGKLKKPAGEKAIIDHILGKFKKPEAETIKKVSKKVSEALEMIIKEGREKAMGEFNSL